MSMSLVQTQNILIVHCPPESIEFPPLQEALLATKLELCGFKVSVLDMNLKLWHHSKAKYKSSWLKINEHYWHDQSRLKSFWQDNRQAVDRIIQSIHEIQPNIVFMDLEFPKEYFGCEIVKKIKRTLPDVLVVVSGFSCYSEKQQHALQKFSGHGIDHFINGMSDRSLPGLFFKLTECKEPQICKREPVDDSDIFPTYNEFKLNEYRKRCLSISFGSGCTGTCLFCKRHIHPDQHFLRTAGQIINEINSQGEKQGVTDFYFGGAPIQTDSETLEILCDALIASPNTFSWSAEAAAHLPFSSKLLAKIKNAGCHTLVFCCVSGSDTILSNINAGFKVEEVENVVRKTAQAGIRVAVQFVVGFPGEYKRELAESLTFATRNKPPVIQYVKAISTLRIHPGTRLFSEGERNNIKHSSSNAIDRWSRPDGNTFYSRKLMQHQLNMHILGLHMYYNPHDLLFKIPHFSEFKFSLSQRHREKKYQLYTLFDPWHAYHSDLLSKKAITYVWEKTHTVEKVETDYPIIQGINDGKRAFVGPETVHLDITNHCNYNCIACWDRSPLVRSTVSNNDYLKKSLSYECVTEFIDNLIELGGLRFIKFGGGGEPMMHPRFKDILVYLRAKDRYVEIDINTNFSRINAELLGLMIDLEVNLLTVSLWAATPEVYVLTHPNQSKTAFKNIVANLKKIKTENTNTVLNLFIHNVLMSQNHHEVQAMLDLALEVKADEVNFTLVDPVPGKTDSLLLSQREQMTIIESLKTIKPFVDKYNIYHDPKKDRSIKITDFHGFLLKMTQAEIAKGIYDQKTVNKIPCYIGWLYTRIMADGRVIPCCKGHRLPMGNLNKNNFIDIWNSPRYELFRNNGKTLSRSAPYFSVMGNEDVGQSGCLNCDNVMHNTVMHDKYLCYSNLAKWFFFKMGQWKKNR